MLPLRGVGEAVSSVSLLVPMMDDRPHPLQLYSPERRNLAESHVVSLLSPWKDGNYNVKETGNILSVKLGFYLLCFTKSITVVASLC